MVVVGLTFFPPTDLVNVAPGGPLASLKGTITANSESGAGVLNLTVSNGANYPFTRIDVSSTNPSMAGAAHNIIFSYNGMAVSQSNPLAIGDSAIGMHDFGSGLSSGASYFIVVTITLSNGQLISANTTITVQS